MNLLAFVLAVLFAVCVSADTGPNTPYAGPTGAPELVSGLDPKVLQQMHLKVTSELLTMDVNYKTKKPECQGLTRFTSFPASRFYDPNNERYQKLTQRQVDECRKEAQELHCEEDYEAIWQTFNGLYELLGKTIKQLIELEERAVKQQEQRKSNKKPTEKHDEM
jgi:hypothetical protein